MSYALATHWELLLGAMATAVRKDAQANLGHVMPAAILGVGCRW
ncbi:MAG TPA: hypothetical protein VGG28_17270 [Kofleriaceae bacterium]